MSDGSTKLVIAERTLPVEQQTALDGLSAGMTVKDAAELAGVSRHTVHRWLRDDAAFIAAFNQWREELQEHCRSHLLTLTSKASAAIQRALEAGDARAALEVLKGMGLLTPVKTGSTDAEEIRRTAELKRKSREVDLTRAENRLKSDEEDAMLGM